MLANIYLHELDVEMREAGLVMVRYADDAVVLIRDYGLPSVRFGCVARCYRPAPLRAPARASSLRSALSCPPFSASMLSSTVRIEWPAFQAFSPSRRRCRPASGSRV
ncbi:MAG TPA: hypothetical protein DCX80_12110 [Chloroflexi bacterium]|nr:hypothetical protein [Chloroflexota bacterium]